MAPEGYTLVTLAGWEHAVPALQCDRCGALVHERLGAPVHDRWHAEHDTATVSPSTTPTTTTRTPVKGHPYDYID